MAGIKNQIFALFYYSFSKNSQYIRLLPFFDEQKAKSRLLIGHRNLVSSTDLSPDAKMLVSGSEDNTIKLWNLEKSSFETPRHIDLGSRATHINFSLSHNLFASTTTLYNSKLRKIENTELELWSLDGKLLRRFSGENSTVIFSPSSPIFAAASSNKVLQIWSGNGKTFTLKESNIDETISLGTNDIAITNNNHTQLLNKDGQSKIFLKGHEDPIYLIEFSSDGNIIATASKDNTVKIWQRNGKLIKTLKGYKDKIENISLSSNGEILVIHDGDNTVKFFQRDGTLIKTVQGYGRLNVRFSPDDKTLAIFGRILSDDTQTLTIWKIDGTEIATFEVDGSIKGFSSDGRTIVTEDDNSKHFWDLNGTLLNTFDKATHGYSQDYRIWFTVKDDKTLQLWQHDGNKIATIKIQGELQYKNSYSRYLLGYRFSPDSKIIALRTNQNTVELWETDGTFIKSIPFQIERFSNEYKPEPIPMNFSPNSQTFAIRSDDKTVKLWSLNDKTTLSFPHDYPVTSVNFRPDGQLLASASTRNVKLWSLDGRLLTTFERIGSHDVSFSPDGQLIAAGGNDNISVWDSDLDKLLERGCNWARNYLKHNPKVKERDRTLCDDIGTHE
ncbi:MAG: hypothetical protein RID53_29525 [Coleofasciculus sp. B1-GNL1-01]|uniref:WD40 repeat domain-containing protein n=1 Tax=Coleofasciculus sp. B1-GNL1-01 TaxID=3068484 RepID=UPI0032F1B7D8